jgi:hypothetical protein
MALGGYRFAPSYHPSPLLTNRCGLRQHSAYFLLSIFFRPAERKKILKYGLLLFVGVFLAGGGKKTDR